MKNQWVYLLLPIPNLRGTPHDPIACSSKSNPTKGSVRLAKGHPQSECTIVWFNFGFCTNCKLSLANNCIGVILYCYTVFNDWS